MLEMSHFFSLTFSFRQYIVVASQVAVTVGADVMSEVSTLRQDAVVKVANDSTRSRGHVVSPVDGWVDLFTGSSEAPTMILHSNARKVVIFSIRCQVVPF